MNCLTYFQKHLIHVIQYNFQLHLEDIVTYYLLEKEYLIDINYLKNKFSILIIKNKSVKFFLKWVVYQFQLVKNEGCFDRH